MPAMQLQKEGKFIQNSKRKCATMKKDVKSKAVMVG